MRLGFGQTNAGGFNVPHINYELVYEPLSNTGGIIEGHQSDITLLKNI
jgi:hypothetical protein